MVNQQGRYCLVGIGNTLMGDDGIAARVCEILSAENLPATDIITVHQLQAEYITWLSGYDMVIFIDACLLPESSISIRETMHAGFFNQGTHFMDIDQLAVLLQRLCTPPPKCFVCSIPGNNFSLGETLSNEAENAAVNAADLLRQWLTEISAFTVPGHTAILPGHSIPQH